MLDAITPTTNVMDEDLRETLLDDNFVNQAAEENVDQRVVDYFDYEAHITRLMDLASGVRLMRRGNITDKKDSEDDDDRR
ncbi:hypothetical protein CCR75_004181 [Bremia lactucae]|uniref:Uncharacterized protein n=1 Tax=Bremia lactucae TaxID=4779 RepID=A0A976FL90_BRELC|nr:hypothetical protein CCR75_004181 [Bremia lactucae]